MHTEGKRFSQKAGFCVCVWGGGGDSQKKNDPCVGHRKSQSQNPAAHYGVAEVKDGHAERRLSLELQREDNREENQRICCISVD